MQVVGEWQIFSPLLFMHNYSFNQCLLQLQYLYKIFRLYISLAHISIKKTVNRKLMFGLSVSCVEHFLPELKEVNQCLSSPLFLERCFQLYSCCVVVSWELNQMLQYCVYCCRQSVRRIEQNHTILYVNQPIVIFRSRHSRFVCCIS